MLSPVIGFTLDHEPGASGSYSAYPWLALRENYVTSCALGGGIAVGIPPQPAQAHQLLERIDALVVTGGAFDIDPALYGEQPHHPLHTKDIRTTAEMALIAGARARNMPVLGICGGMQLMAVMLGGTLIQDISAQCPGALPHEQPNPRHQAGHVVNVTPGTLLSRITGRSQLAVNSAHHQAVRSPGRGLVSAVAEDGIIEAVEDPGQNFFLGVQWHPEFAIDAPDLLIFKKLVRAAMGEPL